MNKTGVFLMGIVACLFIGASLCLFTVDQTQQAIVLQLGQPKGEPRGPGLHVKIPFAQEVRHFDRRVLPVDPEPEQMVISSANEGNPFFASDDQIESESEGESNATENEATQQSQERSLENISGEPIIVDTFARYKIIDPLQFMKTLGSVYNANSRIENILSAATKTVLGKTTLPQLLSEDRTRVMSDIRRRVNRDIQKDALGIEIVDVRIVRADLTADLRTSTVQRMKSELKERATETRAKGEERALEIRSTADKERTVIIAEAEKQAQIIRGQGDEEAIKIYADAFNKDPEFYGFLRSMEAYKKTLADPDTQLILSPKSEFFQYFDRK